MTFSTGSERIDRLLGRAINTGIVTDLFGENGSGKSQLCFSISANLLKNTSEKIMFIDTEGTFRPERIEEIINEKNPRFLDRITYIRVFSIFSQFNAIDKISKINPKLVIVDTATSIIATESHGAARHLILMKFLHKLSHYAIKYNCAVIITNSIRDRIFYDETDLPRVKMEEQHISKTKFQREFMDKSISISTHVKLKFSIINAEKNIYKISFIQPLIKRDIFFTIVKNGIAGLN
ncbi:MAG: AAA family ATPase [Nitrososphaeraceae archaeon]|nr:AAA family ATPase [Nitrososphaeraceae archaeon]